MNLHQLAQTRPLTPAQSLKVVQRLCEALDYIHQKGLIHRDVKPANVCLRRGGHPVLMDFSLIKDENANVQLTAPGSIMGTVSFMPPEQAQPDGPFGNVCPKSDVYSLGGTLYWLLTGKPPFKGRTPMETIIKLMREQPQPPSAHNPSLPTVVDNLVIETLSKVQEKRPQGARDLCNRIEQIFQNHRPELERAERPALAQGGAQPPKPRNGSPDLQPLPATIDAPPPTPPTPTPRPLPATIDAPPPSPPVPSDSGAYSGVQSLGEPGTGSSMDPKWLFAAAAGGLVLGVFLTVLVVLALR